MTSLVLVFVPFAMLHVSVEAGDFMDIEVRPRFEECPTMNGHVERCRERLLSAPELTGVTLNPNRDDQITDYENCMLEKLGLTVREAMVWCEHKGSLARKMALCHEYLLRLNAPHISDRIVVKVIDEFQVCLENSEVPTATVHEKPSEVPRGHPSRAIPDHSYENFDKHSRYNDKIRKAKRDHGPIHKDIVSDEDENDHYEYQEEHRYSGSLNSDFHYYYPRREHGLGNETSTANQTTKRPISQPTNIGHGSKPPKSTRQR